MPTTYSSDDLEQVQQKRTAECRSLLSNESLSWDEYELFIRAFKQEEEFEVWARQNAQAKFTRIAKYDFCKSSGTLGPKLKEGDLQIPEGIYHINHFNPKSKFHLSLGINYPNAADLSRADRSAPGSEIYIHGGCLTVGCIPITDAKIELVYLLAERASNLGQAKVPVHIFPARLSSNELSALLTRFPINKELWHQLRIIYELFERTKQIPPIHIDELGKYSVQPR